MKTRDLIFLLIAATFLMNGCNSGVDLNNINTKAEVGLKFALPLGELTASIGDFVGDSQVPNLFVGSDHVLFFRDTAYVTRQYHDIDLASKVSNAKKTCDVHQVLSNQGLLIGNKVYGNGNTIALEFPYIMHLSGINMNDSLGYERLDSAHIKSAKFISNINTRNLPLDASYIKHVEIVLGNEFRRPEGSIITVIDSTKGETLQYQTDIDIEIDAFTLDLLDHEKSNGNTFVVKDSCEFQILFYVNVPYGTTINVPNDAAFQYNMKVQFITYDALWGYFNPSSQMHDEDTLDLSSELTFWNQMKKATLPFSDPVIDVYVTTQVAGCMRIWGDYIFTQSKDETTPHYASFDQAMTKHDKMFEDWTSPGYVTQERLWEGGYLPPVKSADGDSVRYHIQLDKDWKNGHIDNLFSTRPDYIGYKFHVDFDRSIEPQIRIVPNTFVRIDGVFTLPLKFNKGTELSYAYRIDDIDLSSITIDSLLAEADIVDTITASRLILAIGLENSIPLRVQGISKFLNERGEVIMDPDDPTRPLHFGDTDTLNIEAPKLVKGMGGYYVAEPGKSAFFLEIDQQHFDLFSQIKSINIEAILDTKDLNNIFDQDPSFHMALTEDDELSIQVGIITDAKVVMDFGNKK